MPNTVHRLSIFFFLEKAYLFIHLFVHGGMCLLWCVCVEARGQFIGVDYFLLSWGSRDQT